VSDPGIDVDTGRSAIADALERDGLAVSVRVIQRMYAENSFWMERFGERGRVHAVADAGRHVEHLVTALRSNSSAVFVGYARWLQSVLTTRGMCTRHLSDNFDFLGVELQKTGWLGRQLAIEVLAEGTTALFHREGEAGAIFAQRTALVQEVASRLYQKHPEWLARWGERGRERCVDDLDYHVVYLGDALANDSVSDYVAYARFVRDFLRKRNVELDHVRVTLETFAEVLSHGRARSFVEDAISGLDERNNS
jgi:hypothetical protein